LTLQKCTVVIEIKFSSSVHKNKILKPVSPLTPWNRIIFEKQVLLNLVKVLLPATKPNIWFSFLPDPSTGSSPEAAKSRPYSPTKVFFA
jgi:hypothetical protein